MTYEAWMISFQSSEQAARAAWAESQQLRAEVERLREDCCDAYQVVGTLSSLSGSEKASDYDATKALDNLMAAARPLD